MNDDPFANLPPRTMECPFKVGDRIHETGPFCVNVAGPMILDGLSQLIDPAALPLDSFKPDATVTELTERGFKYRYDDRVPIGRAQWGTWTEGGECFEGGFQFWRKI